MSTTWEVWAAPKIDAPLLLRAKTKDRKVAERHYKKIDSREHPPAIALKARGEDGRFYFARLARLDSWMDLHEPRR